MNGQFGFLGYVLLQSVAMCAVVLALYDIVRRVLGLDKFLVYCTTFVLLGLIGYATFWIAYINYTAFSILKIIGLCSLVLYAAFLAYRRAIGACFSQLTEPLLYTFLFFLVVITLGFSNGGLDEPTSTAANRFSHELPMDNIIPVVLAKALSTGHVASPLYGGGWLSSDRPPLQTGLFLFLTLSTNPLPYQIVASLLQATFLLGVWGLLVASGLPTSARRLTMLACCLLPTAIINTFYVWPKMMAVGYLMLVFALLFCYQPAGEFERKLAGILLGAAAALAILSHGTSFFALIGFGAIVLIARPWPLWKPAIYGLASLVATYAPWMVYQNVLDPPGNRLLKLHLAGVFAADERGFVATLRDAYAALTWHDYLQGRFENVKALIGPWPQHLRNVLALVLDPDNAVAANIRVPDFFNFVPSLHLLSIAALCAILLMPFMTSEEKRQRNIALQLLGATLVTCVVFAALMFIPGSTVNHQGTYAVQVSTVIFAFMVLSLRASALAIAFIAVQTITVATLYAFTLPHDPRLWPVQVVCVVAAASLFGYTFYPTIMRLRDRPQIETRLPVVDAAGTNLGLLEATKSQCRKIPPSASSSLTTTVAFISATR